jgi:hypothetical protein
MSADPIDLTTLPAVKSLAEVQGSADDVEIQGLITGFSRYILTRTGRDSLNSAPSYVEVYDGNGSFRMFLRNSPILTITSLMVNGVEQAASPGYGRGGYFIEQSGRSIAIRPGGSGTVFLTNSYPSGGLPFSFVKGIGNIQVSYTAGYTVVPADLEFTCRTVCATYTKRKAWLDLKSKSLSAQGGVGTTSYRDWEMAPHDDRVILSYQRWAMV